MNLPNKITLSRIILTVIIIILCLFPFHSIGLRFPDVKMLGMTFNKWFTIYNSIYY